MSDELKTKESFDLTGLACPMPIVKLSKAMKILESGDIIDALTSDPGRRRRGRDGCGHSRQ